MTAVVQLETFRSREGMASPSELLALARGRTPEDRERLLRGITALCDATPPGAGVSPVLTEIFMILAGQAERDIRKVLSQCLAGAEWAPPALINILALDEIEIARPVIARSPILKDQDLIRVLVEATIEHQIEIARRPNLSGAVSDVIIDRGEPSCVTALASNRTAEISEAGLRRLVEQSRRIAALRAPLTRHPRLSQSLAMQLQTFVGQALKDAIGERFRVDQNTLSEVIDTAVAQTLAITPIETALSERDQRDESERRLVAKLQAAGQLRAGFLIRAIREKRLSLFEHGLATLAGFPVVQVRRAIVRQNSEALFYACAAVGIDKAVFPAIVDEIRKLSDGWPGDVGKPTWMTAAPSAASAARTFRSLMGDVAA